MGHPLCYVGIWNGTEYEYRLVLDIGGIHEAKNGNINFATGAVADWPATSSTARTGRSLYQIFLDTDGDGVVSETEANGELAQYFDGEVFADFTKLSLKFFYESGSTTHCTGVLAYSIGAYCGSQAAGTAMQDFAAATAVYSYYAKQYFAA